MLSALDHPRSTSVTPSVALTQPKPSPFDPPSDLIPGLPTVRQHSLHTQGDVKISREIVWDSYLNKPQIIANQLVVETGDAADDIHVRSWPGGKLQIFVNGTPYLFDIKKGEEPPLRLVISTHGGNDHVKIDDDVQVHVDADGGDGDDTLQAGGGKTALFGGNGNDCLRLGSGLGFATGNDGDDTLIGGSGNNVMYGNSGNDRLYAGAGSASKQSYLDGGEGNDQLYAGNGHSVLHGGKGDDHLIGHDRTSFYTGKGQDRIHKNTAGDLIYAKTGDRFSPAQGSIFTAVTPGNAGERGFTVEGHEAFTQQVADDLELLRGSPTGQSALREMDRLAEENGGNVTILQGRRGDSAYFFDSTQLRNLTPQARRQVTASDEGVISNGIRGSRADRGIIEYDAADIRWNASRTSTDIPISGLFHEIAHAYNGATGTFLAGETVEKDHEGTSIPVPNAERQAVGLPNDAQPFDLDNDPSTPPSTLNPEHFTENGLNREMGLPLRNSYV